MKTRLAAAMFFALAAGCSTAQKPDTEASQRIEVTTQTMASLPAGEAYRLDLTRGDRTIYALAADVDRSRVMLVDRDGDVAMNDLLGSGGRGELLVGTLDDLRSQTIGPLLGISARDEHSCGVLVCTCDGAGCSVLLLEGKCRNDKLVCDADANCYCLAK